MSNSSGDERRLLWVISRYSERDSRADFLEEAAAEVGAVDGIDCSGELLAFQDPRFDDVDGLLLAGAAQRVVECQSMFEAITVCSQLPPPTSFRRRLLEAIEAHNPGVLLIHRSAIWADKKLAPWLISPLLDIQQTRNDIWIVGEGLSSALGWSAEEESQLIQTVFDYCLDCEHPIALDLVHLFRMQGIWGGHCDR